MLAAIAAAQRVLAVGIGGGGDVVGALVVAELAAAVGTPAVVGGLTWERRPIDPLAGPRRIDELSDAEVLNEHAALAGPDTTGPGGFHFAESHMARHLGEPVLLLDITAGPAAVAAALGGAAGRLGCDLVVLTDVGGDVLAHGDEAGLGSPLADAICLAAAPLLAERAITVLGAIFGAGCDGELTPGEVLERLAEVAAAGGHLGSWGPGSAELDRLEAAVAQIPTEASTMGLRCARGLLGSAPIREGRRTVQLTSIGGLVFFFDPPAALRSAARCARLVADTTSLDEANEILLGARHRHRAGLGVGSAPAPAELALGRQMNGNVPAHVTTLERVLLAGLAAVALCAGAAPAAAQVQPYRANDHGGFRDVLPPGTNGRSNLVELAAFLATGARPAHNDDQREMYARLLSATPGVTNENLGSLFKDSSFGIAPGDQDRAYSPADGLTITRDRSFGVPHVYGTTRAAAMFGLGYIAAEDRLFFIDVLRHTGRGELSSFAGGAAGNRKQDAEQWALAPYTEADLQRQADQLDDLFGAEGAQLQQDATSYVAGVNKYITEVRLDLTRLPGEYAAIGRPGGPEPWKVTDIIATASLVGGIFGKGGGDELTQMELRRSFRARYGARRGERLWREWAAYEDADAPTTVKPTRRFPYQTPPKKPARGGMAIADAGSLRRHNVVAARTGSAASTRVKAPAIAGLFSRQPALGGHVQRARHLRGRVLQRPPARRLRPADGVLRAGDPHGAGRARARHGRPRRGVPGGEPLRPARPRPGLRVERDVGRPGHHRHVRGRPLRAGRREADDGVDALPPARELRADRGAREDQPLGADAGRRDAGRQHAPARRAHEARARQRAGDDQGQADRLHAAALDVHARDRLGARVLGLQQSRQGARRADLPAGGAQDRLHVQLALRRRPRHRLLQLRRQPAARGAA